MAFIQKDMKKILNQYASFGYTIYYLCETGKADLNKVEASFLKLNPEISEIYLDKMIRSLDGNDMDEAYSLASQGYTKENCLLDYFQIEGSKLDLRKDIYETALNYLYTGKLLEHIRSSHEDVGTKRVVDGYLNILDSLIENTKQEVVQKEKQAG